MPMMAITTRVEPFFKDRCYRKTGGGGEQNTLNRVVLESLPSDCKFCRTKFGPPEPP